MLPACLPACLHACLLAYPLAVYCTLHKGAQGCVESSCKRGAERGRPPLLWETFIRSNLSARVEEEFQPRIFRGGKDRWKRVVGGETMAVLSARLMLALFDSLSV